MVVGNKCKLLLLLLLLQVVLLGHKLV